MSAAPHVAQRRPRPSKSGPVWSGTRVDYRVGTQGTQYSGPVEQSIYLGPTSQVEMEALVDLKVAGGDL